jgi:hypothetical protein
VIAYSMSSELEFSQQTQASFNFFSQQLPARSRQLAPHALVIDCTGYLTTEQTDKGRRGTDFYASIHPKWKKEVLDETDIATDGKHPTILHEYNWWSCYPDPADRRKYATAQLIPYWLDTLEQTAWANGQGELIRTYRENSLWLQALARKDGIEYARRSAAVEGYILWLLIDFGHWSEGLLDDFWNPKNVAPEEFLQSNGETVILLAQEGDRCLRMGERARIPLAISHYGETDLDGSVLDWHVAGGIESQHGRFVIGQVPRGGLTRAGSAEFSLPSAATAYQFELRVALQHNGHGVNTNHWSFWAFPPAAAWIRTAGTPATAGTVTDDGVFLRLGTAATAAIPQQAAVVVADAVDEALVDYVAEGGRCLLQSRGAVIENTAVYHGATTFYGIFRTIPWNAGTSGNSGTLISHHPALADFPHEGKCDLPFLHMILGRLPMEFSPLRRYGVTPIIRNIDHYIANRSNAYLLEFRVGKGQVLVTSLGILEHLAARVEVRYLLGCLLDYLNGTPFAGAATVPKEEFRRLFAQRNDSATAKNQRPR